MTSPSRKVIATAARGHKAVAAVTPGELIASVTVWSGGKVAMSTCHPLRWRSKVAELILRLHHEYDCNGRIEKYWSAL